MSVLAVAMLASPACDDEPGPADAATTPGKDGGSVTPTPDGGQNVDGPAPTPPVDGPAPGSDSPPGSADGGMDLPGPPDGGPDTRADAAESGAEAGLPGDAGPSADPTAGIDVLPISWGACPATADVDDCARVKVPLDYAAPGGQQLEIFVGRKRATDPARRIGSLFLNPGGPGGAGVTGGFLSIVSQLVSPELRARFDLVSWDPRGVPDSAAVDCKAMPTLNALQRTYDLSSRTTQKEAVRAAFRQYVQQCASNDKLLPYVGTDATVSDLELLRRGVGDPKLTYVGFSYGTNIGQRYLVRYPERTRAMVLDGVDPIWKEDLQDVDQDLAFEGALVAFFNWCGRARAADCPFARQSSSKAAAYDALAASIKATPLRTDLPGKTLTGGMLTYAIGNLLYAQEQWPELAVALEAARGGNGTLLYQSGDSYLGPDGPAQDPFNAIGCADGPPISEAQIEALAVKLKDARIGLTYSRLSCLGWPVNNLARPPGAVPAVPPVVLIGSTGDAATPYKWAMSAAARLPGARLLTSVSHTHTAYLFSGPCIASPVDRYLVDGTLPAAGIRCSSPEPRAMPPGRQPFDPLRSLLRPRRR